MAWTVGEGRKASAEWSLEWAREAGAGAHVPTQSRCRLRKGLETAQERGVPEIWLARSNSFI